MCHYSADRPSCNPQSRVRYAWHERAGTGIGPARLCPDPARSDSRAAAVRQGVIRTRGILTHAGAMRVARSRFREGECSLEMGHEMSASATLGLAEPKGLMGSPLRGPLCLGRGDVLPPEPPFSVSKKRLALLRFHCAFIALPHCIATSAYRPTPLSLLSPAPEPQKLGIY